MERNTQPIKKPSGCMGVFGGCLTLICLVVFLICVSMIFYTEDEMDNNRAEYAAAQAEYEESLEAYNADSAHLHAEYQRILAEIGKAEEAGDSVQVVALTDSLTKYEEPEYVARGAIGFNIGGAFFLFFAILTLIPLSIGAFILIYYRDRKRKYKRYLEEQ